MELYSAMVEHGDAVYFPATIGQYRDTPLRPANLLRFAEEEILWLKERLKCWPANFRQPILRLWAGRRNLLLSGKVPLQLDEYKKFLALHGVVYYSRHESLSRLDQIHRAYKLWCSVIGHC